MLPLMALETSLKVFLKVYHGISAGFRPHNALILKKKKSLVP
jgi:hypothetical protein